MKRLIALLSVLTVVLSACGAPTYGKVLDRRYEAAYTDRYTTMQCFSYNAQGACTANIPQYHEDYHPERWQLKLKSEDKTGWRTVSEEEYTYYEPGSCYHCEGK